MSLFVIFFLVVVMFSDVDNIISLLLCKFETVKDVKYHFLDTAMLFISMNTFTHRHFVFLMNMLLIYGQDLHYLSWPPPQSFYEVVSLWGSGIFDVEMYYIRCSQPSCGNGCIWFREVGTIDFHLTSFCWKLPDGCRNDDCHWFGWERTKKPLHGNSSFGWRDLYSVTP